LPQTEDLGLEYVILCSLWRGANTAARNNGVSSKE
jgi:hypothetical protein